MCNPIRPFPYGTVVDIITKIKESGIRNVGLITRPRNLGEGAQ